MEIIWVVNVDGDGEIDLEDAEEFLEEKFKLLVGANIIKVLNSFEEMGEWFYE